MAEKPPTADIVQLSQRSGDKSDLKVQSNRSQRKSQDSIPAADAVATFMISQPTVDEEDDESVEEGIDDESTYSQVNHTYKDCRILNFLLLNMSVTYLKRKIWIITTSKKQLTISRQLKSSKQMQSICPNHSSERSYSKPRSHSLRKVSTYLSKEISATMHS